VTSQGKDPVNHKYCQIFSSRIVARDHAYWNTFHDARLELEATLRNMEAARPHTFQSGNNETSRSASQLKAFWVGVCLPPPIPHSKRLSVFGIAHVAPGPSSCVRVLPGSVPRILTWSSTTQLLTPPLHLSNRPQPPQPDEPAAASASDFNSHLIFLDASVLMNG